MQIFRRAVFKTAETAKTANFSKDPQNTGKSRFFSWKIAFFFKLSITQKTTELQLSISFNDSHDREIDANRD